MSDASLHRRSARAERLRLSSRTTSRTARAGTTLLLLAALTGCGALHPIRGVPASHVAPEFLGPSRDGLRTINPMLLTRSRPCEHLIDANDVLAVYVPGVLGTISTEFQTSGEAPPINFPTDPEMPPTIGYPIQVRGDGTISLPQVPPINVRGMTLAQAEEAVRQTYVRAQKIAVNRDRILVSLQRAREYRVMVVRQETASIAQQTQGPTDLNLGPMRRGSARIVNLKAYENDVMHALSRIQGIDGLPGLDAERAIYVVRKRASNGIACGPNWPAPAPTPGTTPSPYQTAAPVVRYQSPTNDYRTSSSSYSGHSFTQSAPSFAPSTNPQFAAFPPATPQGGRYGATPPLLTAPTNASGRYPGVSAANFQQTALVSAAPDGQFGATPPVQSFQPAGLPTSPIASGRYPAPNPYGSSAANSFAPAPAAAPSRGPMSPQADDRTTSAGFQPSFGAAGPTAALGAGLPTPPYRPTAGLPAPQSPIQRTNFADPYQTMTPASPALAQVPTAGYPAAAPMDPIPAGPASSGAGISVDSYFRSMMMADFQSTLSGPGVIRIPIYVTPGEFPRISEADVTLEDGDIVFIESRDSEVYYTAGLLGGGQYTLPRDKDLHILEAISIAQSPRNLMSGGAGRRVGGVTALNQDVTISASKLIVLRTLADKTRIPIEVDLNKVKSEMTGRENIIVQPGDVLVLQYSCVEAVAAFIERNLLEGAIFTLAGSQIGNNNN